MRGRENEKQLGHQQSSRERAEKLERKMTRRSGFDLKIQEPNHEQEQDHDRAGIDDDLQEADHHSVLADEQNGDGHQRCDQREQRMNRVALDDDAERGDDRQRAEKYVEERRHHWTLPVATTMNAVSSTLNSPSGTSPFHPRRIN